MDCPHTKVCPLFPLFVLSANLEIWKDRFCSARYESCVRFQRSREGERVPDSLLPNGHMLRKASAG